MVHELLGLNDNRVVLKGAPGVRKDLEEVRLNGNPSGRHISRGYGYPCRTLPIMCETRIVGQHWYVSRCRFVHL